MRNRILQRLEQKAKQFKNKKILKLENGGPLEELSGLPNPFISDRSLGSDPFSLTSIRNVRDHIRTNEDVNKELDMVELEKEAMQKRMTQAQLQGESGPNSSIVYETGGLQLPGGVMTNIPGSDAVEFTGQTHDEGGIMMDNITEVEDGETMDQVTMKDGGKHDYFFSHHLKHGGVPFAEHHKSILNNGGDQGDIDYLAKMQEKKAGRTTDKIGTAELGGIVKYDNGGEKKDIKEGKFRVASYETYGGLEGDLGTVADYQPGLMVNGVQMYADKDDVEFRKLLKTDDFSTNWMANVDPEILKAAGINSFEDMGTKANVLKYQKAWNAANPDNLIDEDGLFGEQTFRTAKVKAPVDNGEDDNGEDGTKDPIEYTVSGGEDTNIERKNWQGTLLGAASMIPAVMAFTEQPDYMESPDLIAPGVVKAERIAKTHLDRVDYNDLLAKNAGDSRAMNLYIDTQAGGPATMSNKMMAFANKKKADLEIKNAETKANVAIANQEKRDDDQRRKINSELAFNASKINATNFMNAEKENARNNMLVDEFNRGADATTKDRKLAAVQYGINALASLHRDKQMKDASDNVASAISGQTGVLERWQRSGVDMQGNPLMNIINQNTKAASSSVPAKQGGYRRLKLIRR